MSLVRFSTIFSLLVLSFVPAATAQVTIPTSTAGVVSVFAADETPVQPGEGGVPAETDATTASQNAEVAKEIPREIAEQILAEIRQMIKDEIVRSSTSPDPGTETDSEKPATPSAVDSFPALSDQAALEMAAAQQAAAQSLQAAVATLDLKEKILKHYREEIAGAKSRSANPRKAVEKFRDTFLDASRRAASFQGETIDALQQEQMLERLRSELRGFFEDNPASAADWQAFLRGIEINANGIDATKKSNWVAVLDELASAFGEVAAEIQKEEARNPLLENRDITAGRSPGRAGADQSAHPGAGYTHPMYFPFHHHRRMHWYHRYYYRYGQPANP